jgi:outer membrane receptor protein involved in Fe transport
MLAAAWPLRPVRAQPSPEAQDAGTAPQPTPSEPPVAALPETSPEPTPAAPAASAQAVEEVPTQAQPSDDEMVVTGSRIKRSASLAASAPVEMLDRKAIERTGASNVSDLIQTLTAAAGSGFQGGGSPGNQGGGAYGATSINLRGLGAASTLVLVNGRRLVPSGGGGGSESFADVGVIPLAAIERIEILKGGGSAIYGADAVGGVVNIITRSAWDGARVELDGQGTTRADHGELTVSGAYGAKTERSRVLLALSYNRRSELRSDKRSFSRDAMSGLDAGSVAHDRWVPEGAAKDWPEDVMQPEVTLPNVGNYAFTLWVTDDRGRISDPSTISVRVQPAE